MTRTPVQSSNIAAIGYDPVTRDLDVEFKNGKVYTYTEVVKDDHAALMGAASVGKHLNEHIKGKYHCVNPTPKGPTPEQFEFGVMSNVISVEALDPNVAAVVAIMHYFPTPLIVCYSHEGTAVSVLSNATLEGRSQAEALTQHLGEDLEAWILKNEERIKACAATLQQCKRADRKAA